MIKPVGFRRGYGEQVQCRLNARVKEAVMTRVQQFHRRIAALFVLSIVWVAFVVSMYATTG